MKTLCYIAAAAGLLISGPAMAQQFGNGGGFTHLVERPRHVQFLWQRQRVRNELVRFSGHRWWSGWSQWVWRWCRRDVDHDLERRNQFIRQRLRAGANLGLRRRHRGGIRQPGSVMAFERSEPRSVLRGPRPRGSIAADLRAAGLHLSYLRKIG